MNNVIIIVGLGNPDKKYENTFHNMGFNVVNVFAKKLGVSFSLKNKLNAEIAEAMVNGTKVVLVKPITYMNASGTAVLSAKNFYKAQNENIIVVYDDIDLELGDIRLREKGSAGTHNGMRDIVAKIGRTNFPRLRVGIGRDPKFLNLADFVLSKVPKEKQQVLEKSYETCSEMLAKFVQFNGNVTQVLNWVNSNK